MTTTLTGQLLMHYPIDLPADYDMDIIRRRVATRGSATDDRRGLLCKAYCVSEAGADGSTTNRYAPFYIWTDTRAAAEFLWGGTGFDGIVRDFGRPRVLSWLPAAGAGGHCAATDVTAAVLRTQQIPRDAELTEVARGLAARVEERGDDACVHLTFAGIDPTTWATVEFTTYAEAQPPAYGEPGVETTVFGVLHISRPAQP